MNRTLAPRPLRSWPAFSGAFALWLTVGALLNSGCHSGQTSGPQAGACDAGSANACLCADGHAGSQRCGDDQRWGACRCAEDGSDMSAAADLSAAPDLGPVPDLAQQGRPLLYILSQKGDPFDPFRGIELMLEVVNLADGTKLRSLALEPNAYTELVPAPDGSVLYAATQSELRVLNPESGAVLAALPVLAPRHLVLAPGGDALYLTSGQDLVRIDTRTRAVVGALDTGIGQPGGTAVSPEGTLVGVTSYSSQGVLIVNAATMKAQAQIPILSTLAGCTTQPSEVVFTGQDRAAAWDDNCDSLYQLDLTRNVELTNLVVQTGRDEGSGAGGKLAYSAVSGQIYVIKIHQALKIDPASAMFSPIMGLGVMQSGVVAMADDGKTLALSKYDSADVIALYDPVSGTSQPSVYTTSGGGFHVAALWLSTKVAR